MTFALKFQDHQQFQRSVLRTVAASAIIGALYWVSMRLGISHWPASAIAAVVLSFAMGPALGRFDAKRRNWQTGFRALLLFVGIAAAATLDGKSALIGFGVAAGAAFAIDSQRWRGLVAALAGGAGAVVAAEVASRVLFSAQLASVPTGLVFAIAGAGFGISLAVPMAVRHLAAVADHVSSRYRVVSASTTGEVRDLVGRGYGVWNQARDLPEGDENRALLEEAVLRLFDTAEHWGKSSHSGEGTSEAGLRDRMMGLKERIEATTDAQVRREYEQAHSALGEQLKYIDGIRTNRERVVARLHNYLAAMERLRLALVTAQSSRGASEIGPVASTLEELGRDIESDLN